MSSGTGPTGTPLQQHGRTGARAPGRARGNCDRSGAALPRSASPPPAELAPRPGLEAVVAPLLTGGGTDAGGEPGAARALLALGAVPVARHGAARARPRSREMAAPGPRLAPPRPAAEGGCGDPGEPSVAGWKRPRRSPEGVSRGL